MDFLVCATTGHFADDVQAHCATCDVPIVHRPHASGQLVKICGTCAALKIVFGEIRPGTVRVTQETLREVALFYAETKGTQ